MRRVFGVVQARLSSKRLPGKVLRRLAGKPMIAHLFDRLEQAAGLDGIVLATSDAADDDALAAFAEARAIPCHRGPLDDVAARMLGAAQSFGADALVRVNGDSPLLDPALVARAVEIFRQGDCDLVTNVFPRSFPKGQSVEVLSAAVLKRIVTEATLADREHVTRHIYKNTADYRIKNFASPDPRPDLQLSVDTIDDFHWIQRILSVADDITDPHTVETLVALAEALNERDIAL